MGHLLALGLSSALFGSLQVCGYGALDVEVAPRTRATLKIAHLLVIREALATFHLLTRRAAAGCAVHLSLHVQVALVLEPVRVLLVHKLGTSRVAVPLLRRLAAVAEHEWLAGSIPMSRGVVGFGGQPKAPLL